MTQQPPEQEPTGRLRPVSAAALTGWGVAGLVIGWLVRPVSERWQGSAPLVTWLPALALFFVAVVLAATARATRRAMRGERERPDAQRMVNRFVLARACALVGAVVAGGYAGFALSWVGSGSELATERITRSAAAALGAAAMLAAAVVLERACRVRSEDDAP